MNKSVIIVAGGMGTRMNSTIPKQFIELKGIPVLMHTIMCFHHYDSGISIRVVLPSDQLATWEGLCLKHSFKIKHECVAGGKIRYQSVKNGLNNLSAGILVAIHDGVRPLVSQLTISHCFNAAEKYGAAIPVSDVHETLRQVQGDKSITVNRADYRLVQTPQVFLSDILLESYKTPYQESFTDDASVIEYCGHHVTLVEGNRENIKLTSPVDLKIAEALLK